MPCPLFTQGSLCEIKTKDAYNERSRVLWPRNTVHTMTTKSLLHVASVKKTENKTNLPQLKSLPYYCHLAISLKQILSLSVQGIQSSVGRYTGIFSYIGKVFS